jgi:transposase-like protein
MHTMTKREGKTDSIDLTAPLAADADFLRPLVEAVVQATLEAEMTEVVGAAKGERTAGRLGYRSGTMAAR